mmetsp:Transcript_13773/g.29718  ORF Transcript_13773/g.29718 Transcript_13773/m.29718 type:complete len:140 (-) Transcript_13773:137-556(-)
MMWLMQFVSCGRSLRAPVTVVKVLWLHIHSLRADIQAIVNIRRRRQSKCVGGQTQQETGAQRVQDQGPVQRTLKSELIRGVATILVFVILWEISQRTFMPHLLDAVAGPRAPPGDSDEIVRKLQEEIRRQGLSGSFELS